MIRLYLLGDVVFHARSVRRGSPSSFVVGDMPFGSYEVTQEDALKNAIRLVKEAGVNAVKLEGGRRVKDTVKRIVDAGIPVMGHIGCLGISMLTFRFDTTDN